MIGFFTDPYPDELLYSACARYHRRARNKSAAATARDLFGNSRTKIIVDLQTRLNHLAAQLPSATYSVSSLINEHTMLPFYALFMSSERYEALRRSMCGDGGNSIHGRLGILTSGLDVERLRFCISCVNEDRARANCGEPYWHRVHQAPGVEVCPVHAVFLSESGVSIRRRSSKDAFVTAKQALDTVSTTSILVKTLEPENRDHQALLRLAKDAAWLLNERTESNLNVLRQRYICRMIDQGVAIYTGKVSHTRLKERFLNYYSAELLEHLNCGLKLRYNWLYRLTTDWSHARHPVCHLLLIQMLGCSAEEFFRLPTEFKPFGKGPWPCLNTVGGHYREARITECVIIRTSSDRSKLTGKFKCDCGFAYSRVGMDATDERRYQYDQVISLGEAWYEKLRQMRAVGTYSRSEMAVALGVSVETLKVEIQRLQKSKDAGISTMRQPKWHNKRVSSIDLNQRDRHRKKWLDSMTENPGASRSEYRRLAPAAYNWLSKHDNKWLDENSPILRKHVGEKSSSVDWAERDKKYAAAVREMAAEMLAAPGRPVRASRTAIAQKLGLLAVVWKNSAKLPITNKTLDEVSENLAEYAIRRVRWAADCYRQEHIQANRWKIQARAGVYDKVASIPEVKTAVNEHVLMLRQISENGWRDSQKG